MMSIAARTKLANSACINFANCIRRVCSVSAPILHARSMKKIFQVQEKVDAKN